MQLIALQEIAFFDVTRTGELLNRLSEDTQVIKNASTTNLSEALRSLATAVIGLGFMLQTSWRLTCGCCFCTLLLYFVLLIKCWVHSSFLSCSALHLGAFFDSIYCNRAVHTLFRSDHCPCVQFGDPMFHRETNQKFFYWCDFITRNGLVTLSM